MNSTKLICVAIALVAIAGLLLLFTGGSYYEKGQHVCPIPDPWQQQTILDEQGYDLGSHGIDGNLGCTDSNSQKALRLYWANQYALKSFTPSGAPKGE